MQIKYKFRSLFISLFFILLAAGFVQAAALTTKTSLSTKSSFLSSQKLVLLPNANHLSKSQIANSPIAKNERARAYLNSIPGQGERTAEGQTFLGELDRNSDEFKNSLINIGSAVDNRELLGSIALSSKEHSVLSQIYHGAALERDKHVKAADKAEIIKALNGMLSLAKSYQAESVNAHRQKEDDRGSRLAAELSYMADGTLLLNNNAKKYHRLEGVNQSSLNALNQMFDAQSAARKDQMLAIFDFATNFAGGGVGFVVKQGLKQGVKQSAKKSVTQAKQALDLRNKTKGKITIDGKAVGKNGKVKKEIEYDSKGNVISRTPKSLQDQMTLSAAKAGKGKPLDIKLKDKRYEGMTKKSLKSESNQGKVSVVNYVEDSTGKRTDFKFKKHSTD